MSSNGKFKGLPLEMWKSERMLERLNEEELKTLRSLLIIELQDCTECFLEGSLYKEANEVIERVKK